MPPAAELLNIRKTFGSLTALDGVNLTLAPGRVHGLLGENGAGKTTLMNILYGLARPDSGAIRAGGWELALSSPRDAIAAGFGMVHQHFMLAGAMSVLDNVLLGDRRQGAWLDRRVAAGKLGELARSVQLEIDPAARIDDLSVGAQQRVEILKALFRDVRVLILDEPTAVLTPAEADQLFAAVAALRAQGRAVVFISHKLREVKQVCDDLTVLRRGRVVWQGPAESVSPAELARHMVGHDVATVSLERAMIGEEPPDAAGGRESRRRRGKDERPPPQRSPGPRGPDWPGEGEAQVLELDGVDAEGVDGVCLCVAAGEILGIAGVDGNGQEELAETIVGLRPVGGGRVMIGGRDAANLSMGQRRRLGVALIPNDRNTQGLVGSMSIIENFALRFHDAEGFSAGGFMRWRAVRRAAAELSARFDVRTDSIDAPVASLSGGNRQKIILARELGSMEPALIVAMNPARGLDVAATGFVYQQLLDRRKAGAAILLISSELDELRALSDRIAVLYNGRLTLSGFPHDGPDELGRLMTGAAVA